MRRSSIQSHRPQQFRSSADGFSKRLCKNPGITDNRSEAIAQRKLQQLANNSAQVKQLSAFQEMSAKRSETAQLKAGVNYFTAKWHDDDRGGTGAGFKIKYAATFKDDHEFSAADAEFRQHAFDRWTITEADGTVSTHSSDFEDDRYSRQNDPGDYVDSIFVSSDYPGFKEGELDDTDVIDYEFRAEQSIVDTSSRYAPTAMDTDSDEEAATTDEEKDVIAETDSDSDSDSDSASETDDEGYEVIAYIPTQHAKITGAHPRDFRRPADMNAVIKR